MKHIILLAVLVFSLSQTAQASTKPASGQFVADKVCSLYQSKRKKTNPDGLTSVAGRAYTIVETDKYSHWWRVKVPNNRVNKRWISANCGQVKGSSAGSSSNSRVVTRTKKKSQCRTRGLYDSNILAISWQSAFCELKGVHLPECTSLNPSRYDAKHFTLHGYWPNKASCGIDYGFCGKIKQKPATYCDYPALNLSTSVRDALGKVMPSEEYGTCLQRHEWFKHGSCSNMNANQYYSLSMALLEQVNRSGFVSGFIQQNIGKTITRGALQQAFDQAFGAGSHKKVALQCRKGVLMELQIALPKTVKYGDQLKGLLAKPGVRGNGRGSCPNRFKIDAL